ncbi:unnamed protein product [Ixodes pacificus]
MPTLPIKRVMPTTIRMHAIIENLEKELQTLRQSFKRNRFPRLQQKWQPRISYSMFRRKEGEMIKKNSGQTKSRKRKDKTEVSYEHFPHFHNTCMKILYIARQMDKKLNERPCVR